MLERIPGVRRPCDLDVLIFFYRHPRALLTSEKIVGHVGHEREAVATSIEGLIEAGLLSRSQNPSHAARLYVLELDALPGGLLSSFLKVVATREGRIDAMRLLGEEPGNAPKASHRRRPPLAKVA